MRSIWISKPGPPSVLEVRESPDPLPQPGEVRIVVQATGVNFADLMARTGTYPDAPPIPCVVGYEVAGEIDAVGEGVDPARIGEPVLSLCRFGGYSSHRCVPSAQAVRRPEGLDAQTAAAIPVTYLTAYLMLRIYGRPTPGERVLVHSAAGGVGLAALDLCKIAQAETWGMAGKSKHDFLLKRGYDHVLDSHSDAWPTEKMDVILDPVGGASWKRGLDGLRAGGKLICFGFSASATGESRSLWSLLRTGLQVPWLRINPVSLMNENKGVMGVNMGHLWEESERVSGWLAEILKLWEEGLIHPHIHATLPFSQAAEAHSILHRRENMGKVLLTPD